MATTPITAPTAPTAESQPVVTQPTSEAPVTSTATSSTPAVVAGSREELYKRYYASTAAPTETPVATSTSSAAPVVTSTSTEAAPAAKPPDDLISRIATLETALSEATAKLSSLQSPTPPATPSGTATPAVTPEEAGAWIALLQQGKYEDAETLMAKRLGPSIVQEAVNRSMELVRADTDVTNFLKELRSQNSDLLPLEELIGIRAQRRLEAAQAAGKIKSSADYVEQYKAAVTAEAAEARKIVQQFRAAGNNEAMTVKREVLAASTLPPNAIEQPKATPTKEEPPKAETPMDVFAQRRALELKRKGLGN